MVNVQMKQKRCHPYVTTKSETLISQSSKIVVVSRERDSFQCPKWAYTHIYMALLIAEVDLNLALYLKRAVVWTAWPRQAAVAAGNK